MNSKKNFNGVQKWFWKLLARNVLEPKKCRSWRRKLSGDWFFGQQVFGPRLYRSRCLTRNDELSVSGSIEIKIYFARSPIGCWTRPELIPQTESIQLCHRQIWLVNCIEWGYQDTLLAWINAPNHQQLPTTGCSHTHIEQGVLIRKMLYTALLRLDARIQSN